MSLFNFLTILLILFLTILSIGLWITGSPRGRLSEIEWGGVPGSEGLSSLYSTFTVTYYCIKKGGSQVKPFTRKVVPNWSMLSLEPLGPALHHSHSLKTGYPASKCLGMPLLCVCGAHHYIQVESKDLPVFTRNLQYGLTLIKDRMLRKGRSRQSRSLTA